MAEKWISRSDAVGLARRYAFAFGGWQFSNDGVASNGLTTMAAADIPSGAVGFYPTSVGIFTFTNDYWGVVPGKVWLSSDGFSAYAEQDTFIMQRMNSNLPDLLVECDGGRMFIFEYCTDQTPVTDNQNRCWTSADYGATWSLLFTTAKDSIRHFHGAKWDSEYGKLYVYTGDAYDQDSILVCNDVADLVANPATWTARWGLDDATRSTINSSYIIGYNNTKYRITSCIIHGDHIYTGADTYAVEGGSPMYRWHRDTEVIEDIDVAYHSPAADATPPGNAVGEVWAFGKTDTGLLMCFTQSKSAGAPNYGDDKAHVYLIGADGLSAKEVIAIPHTGQYSALPYSIHSIGDWTVISGFFSDEFAAYVGNVREFGESRISQVTLAPKKERPRHKARDLEGSSSQYFQLASKPNPGTDDFWVSAWIKPESDTARHVIISTTTFTATAEGFLIDFGSGVPLVQFNDDTGGAKLNRNYTDVSISTGEWNHVLVTFDRNDTAKAYLWVNGVKSAQSLDISSRTGDCTPSAYNSTIGAQLGGASGFLDGRIALVAYGEGALPTTAEAAELYNNGIGKEFAELSPTLAAKCTHYYNSDEASGTLYDRLGVNHCSEGGGTIPTALGPPR